MRTKDALGDRRPPAFDPQHRLNPERSTDSPDRRTATPLVSNALHRFDPRLSGLVEEILSMGLALSISDRIFQYVKFFGKMMK